MSTQDSTTHVEKVDEGHASPSPGVKEAPCTIDRENGKEKSHKRKNADTEVCADSQEDMSQYVQRPLYKGEHAMVVVNEKAIPMNVSKAYSEKTCAKQAFYEGLNICNNEKGPKQALIDDKHKMTDEGAISDKSSAQKYFAHSSHEHKGLSALLKAFNEHRSLALGPDFFLFLILQALAEMIDEDPEEARKTFVSHEGKMKLQVDNRNYKLGDLSNNWDSAVVCFLQQVT